MAAEESVIGIDLGTTNSCICVYKNGKVEIVKAADGFSTTPSRVYIDDEGNAKVCAFKSKHIQRNIYNAKRFIGKKYNEIKDDIQNWLFAVEKSSDGDIPEVVVETKKGKKRFTATEISSFVLKELKRLADRALGKDERTKTKAIITVPAYFNEKQREETKKAAEMANLEVIQLINEPTAAAYAYCDYLNEINDRTNTNILIYDFGGGTFDVSLVEVNHRNRSIIVKRTAGDSNLGGEDIDKKILEQFGINEYKYRANNKDPSERIILDMKVKCENAKKNLSTNETTDIDYKSIMEIGEEIPLTREDLECISKEILDKTIEIVKNVVSESLVQKVDCIVLVGGSSKMPYIRKQLMEVFKDTQIKEDINSEEVVAHGAALYGNRRDRNGYECVDVISHTLSTDVADGKSEILFPRNHSIPATETRKYLNTTSSGFAHIGIYEGEDSNYMNNKYLGGCRIPITAAEPGTVIFKVIYRINESGIVEITASEESPNKHEVSEKIVLNEDDKKIKTKIDFK